MWMWCGFNYRSDGFIASEYSILLSQFCVDCWLINCCWSIFNLISRSPFSGAACRIRSQRIGGSHRWIEHGGGGDGHNDNNGLDVRGISNVSSRVWRQWIAGTSPRPTSRHSQWKSLSLRSATRGRSAGIISAIQMHTNSWARIGKSCNLNIWHVYNRINLISREDLVELNWISNATVIHHRDWKSGRCEDTTQDKMMNCDWITGIITTEVDEYGANGSQKS